MNCEDKSSLRVRDNGTIDVVRGDETASARFDCVVQPPSTTENAIIERTIQPLVSSCIEGVNVNMLSIGSTKALEKNGLFETSHRGSIASSVFQTLVEELESKSARYAALATGFGNGSPPRISGGSSDRVVALRYTLRISLADVGDCSITDLLSTSSESIGDANEPINYLSTKLSPQLHPIFGVHIRNLTLSPSLGSASSFEQLITVGLDARHVGDYSSEGKGGSVFLRIMVSQNFLYQDGKEQETASCFDLAELPATNPLARPETSVRVSESSLQLNTIEAFNRVVETLAQCDHKRIRSYLQRRGPLLNLDSETFEMLARVPFASATLTQLLQEALGGSSLSLALFFIAPGDFLGSKATLQLAQNISLVHNYPVTNSTTIQGLRWRHLAELAAQTNSANKHIGVTSIPLTNLGSDRLNCDDESVDEVFQENRLLREDRQKLLTAMGALKSKYRALFDGEIEVRKELLASEQEKLSLGRAFVQLQQDKAQQLQALDAAKFEIEHKLIEAEQLVLELQQDDSKKATQIEDLCAKMADLVREKAKLAEDMAQLQTHARDLEKELEREAKKNQQLSLELIVAVNQKLKLQSERDTVDAERKAGGGRVETLEREIEAVKTESLELRRKCSTLIAEAEETRKELARKEVELERLTLANTTERLNRQQEVQAVDQQHSARADQLSSALEVERATFVSEKRALAMQLERALVESKQLSKEKEELVAAWMAKSSESEELRVRNERLSAEAQSQVELFRVKLLRLDDAAKASSGGVGGDTNSFALDELIQSYQSREQSLRKELERSEAERMLLIKRLSAGLDGRTGRRLAGRDGINANDDQRADAGIEELIAEVERLKEQLSESEQSVADALEQRAAQVLATTESERCLQRVSKDRDNLELRCRELEQTVEMMKRGRETASRGADSKAAASIAQMHATLVQQIEEVRRLTLAAAASQQTAPQTNDASNQQTHEQSKGYASTPRDGVDRNDMPEREMAKLRDDNRQLAARLRDGKNQWAKSIEESERRCAGLLTKNAMLTEENQHLLRRVKQLLADTR